MPSQEDGEPSEAEQAQNLLDPILESLKTRFGQRWASVWLEWEPKHLVNIGVVEPTRGEIVDLAAQAQAVTVRWPSGTVDRLSHVTADRWISVVEGRGRINADER